MLDYRLSEQELLELGRQVTELRRQYRVQAIRVIEAGFKKKAANGHMQPAGQSSGSILNQPETIAGNGENA